SLRGSVQVESPAGALFRIRVPLTLSSLRVLAVVAAGQTFLIPASSVRLLLRVAREAVIGVGGRDTISHDGRAIPVVPLASLLGAGGAPQLAAGKLPVVVLSHGTEVALVVDALIDERDIVVKGLGPRLRGAKMISGATILPNGRVALILDVPEVARRARRGSTDTRGLVAEKQTVRKRRVLLVDDSITTRSLEKSILEGAGYTVVTGVDGADGWRLLQETPGIEIVVSDVEMPRMDGFTLVETIRASPRFQHLPVILMTGLAKDVDRARGLAAGASAYLSKGAFDQQLLLDTIERVS
ncbi:MAG: chemotaxis protein CheW, partial [Deltaproteobacteria bacterium]|nr:chemotaxis protein CheW [Deltaproteobacteria bacterium]